MKHVGLANCSIHIECTRKLSETPVCCLSIIKDSPVESFSCQSLLRFTAGRDCLNRVCHFIPVLRALEGMDSTLVVPHQSLHPNHVCTSFGSKKRQRKVVKLFSSVGNYVQP